MSRGDPSVSEIAANEHEGAVLGMVSRWQPLTRHQLLKAFECSPISSYNTSKGSLYPLVGRMIVRGFLVTKTSDGPRESELISLSELGRQALRRWVTKIGSQHMKVHDPLQVRILALGELPREERLRWVISATNLLLSKKVELSDYHERLKAPFSDIVLNYGIAIIDARLRWLDRLLFELADDKELGVHVIQI